MSPSGPMRKTAGRCPQAPSRASDLILTEHDAIRVGQAGKWELEVAGGREDLVDWAGSDRQHHGPNRSDLLVGCTQLHEMPPTERSAEPTQEGEYDPVPAEAAQPDCRPVSVLQRDV